MTLQEYLDVKNPIKKPSKDNNISLSDQYQQLKDRIRVTQYIKDNNLIYHLKIPSRKSKDIFYDVVIEVTDPGNTTVINKLDFRCFSNCPSFTYTFANVFRRRDMLCTWINSKYESEVLQDKPDIRNPNNDIYHERSLFLAITHLLSTGRNNVKRTRLIATTITNYLQVSTKLLHQELVEKAYDKKVTHAKSESKQKEPKLLPAAKQQHRTGSVSNKITPTTSTTKLGKKSSKTKKF